MQENNQSSGNSRHAQHFPIFGSLKGLCFAGILTAMSIVLGKFLQIPNPFQEFIRISFENLPVILAGFALGPVAAVLVGVSADLLGCVLYGYAINPIITVGAAVVGLASGVLAKYIVKEPLILKVIASVTASHLFGSVLIKSYGLAKWYLEKYELGYWEFVGWRLLNYTFIAIAECIIIFLMFKNTAFKKQIEGMRKNDLHRST